MGPWEGMAESEVEKRFPREWAIWNNNPVELSLDGRETLQALQSRVMQGIQAIRQNSGYESVLVATHVAIIRVVTLLAEGKDLNDYKSVKVENAKVFNLDPGFGA